MSLQSHYITRATPESMLPCAGVHSEEKEGAAAERRAAAGGQDGALDGVDAFCAACGEPAVHAAGAQRRRRTDPRRAGAWVLCRCVHRHPVDEARLLRALQLRPQVVALFLTHLLMSTAGFAQSIELLNRLQTL